MTSLKRRSRSRTMSFKSVKRKFPTKSFSKPPSKIFTGVKLMRTLIKNGHIVTAVDSYTADILIDGETIAMIGKDLSTVVGSVDKTIDAAGKLVIPGGIDPHTHMDLPFGGTSSSDDF